MTGKTTSVLELVVPHKTWDFKYFRTQEDFSPRSLFLFFKSLSLKSQNKLKGLVISIKHSAFMSR